MSKGWGERGAQSTDFGIGIAEFQWTRWPRKPIAVHLPHFAFSFFLSLSFYLSVSKIQKSRLFRLSATQTRCCGLNWFSTKRVYSFDNDMVVDKAYHDSRGQNCVFCSFKVNAIFLHMHKNKTTTLCWERSDNFHNN